MCSSMLSLKLFVYSISAHSENRDQRMRQVVAYKRLKTMENHQPSGPKTDHGRLRKVVVYNRFQLLGFSWENFGVFDGRSLMGGGRIRKVVA